ncbi:MAG: TonB family protein [Candidatus Polarisedimenticolaceae bacterium]|nr:TonB family protein [Candidatus Polarisedimenticolaceae bacterium]
MRPSFIHRDTLPWTQIDSEESRFRWITSITLILALAFSFIIPQIDIPEKDRAEKRKLPPRLAQVILERKKIKQPPPPPKIEIPEKKEEQKKEKPKEEKKKKPKEKKPVPKKKVTEKKILKDPDAARKKAAKSGLLAFIDELADLRDEPAITTITKGSKLSKAGNKAKQTSRSIIASATKRSGGINTTKLSRDTGGAGLSGRTTTQARSTLAGNGGGGSAGGKSYIAGRTSEEIQMVFDRHKGTIYRIYNRALRKNPTLRGKVILEITILPSGKVTKVHIVSSQLNDKKLERKLAARIKMFNFGAKDDVDTVIVTYPIDFLPS